MLLVSFSIVFCNFVELGSCFLLKVEFELTERNVQKIPGISNQVINHPLLQLSNGNESSCTTILPVLMRVPLTPRMKIPPVWIGVPTANIYRKYYKHGVYRTGNPALSNYHQHYQDAGLKTLKNTIPIQLFPTAIFP